MPNHKNKKATLQLRWVAFFLGNHFLLSWKWKFNLEAGTLPYSAVDLNAHIMTR